MAESWEYKCTVSCDRCGASRDYSTPTEAGTMEDKREAYWCHVRCHMDGSNVFSGTLCARCTGSLHGWVKATS